MICMLPGMRRVGPRNCPSRVSAAEAVLGSRHLASVAILSVVWTILGMIGVLALLTKLITAFSETVMDGSLLCAFTRQNTNK